MCALRQLPTGTVTFLFTDIEGSTRLLHELGDGYGEVLAEHRRLLREAFSRYGGVEVDTQGDALFVAFARASDAASAALEGQRALVGGAVRVRMGVHTGEPVVTAEGYVGIDVHHGARVMSAGHGGQVLVSQATRDLLGAAFPLRDLGEHRLKDLTAPQRLYQLGDGGFPPLRTLYRTNLPIQPTPLVGRERELEEAGALLRSHRLLTLTGPGGSGKTRLALQLAAEAIEQFTDGVFWVPLQALRDPAVVEHAIAASVGAADGLAEYVASKRLLVLLDNFEQVIEAAPTIASLLAGTPNASVLVTSREPLQLEGEQRYPVEPLPIDDAVVLFTERARLVAPGFQPTAAVEEICRRLDGLPLAVELAAARVALLNPGELLARLERRLPVLTSRSRDAPARQRTLRATIEWSHELLEPGEQQLFRLLAVFRGSFSLEAAEAVCDADLDTLESLVAKNLLRRWGSGRLGILDTIREYALERLDESHEAEDIRGRHAEYFLSVLRDANLNAGVTFDARKPLRHDVAVAEQDNLRAALTWATRSVSVTLGLELATAADWFWTMEDPDEGTRWFQSLLDHPEAETVVPHLRADALRCYGAYLFLCGDLERGERAAKQSLAIYDQLENEYGRAVMLHRLGIFAMVRGDLERARELVEEAHALHARKQEPVTRAFRLGEMTGTLGAIARDAGDDERAYALISESAAAAREAGIVWWEGGMLAELAALALNAGRLDEAEARARESLAIAESLRDRPGRVFGIGLLAWVAAARGEVERAARLWGAIEDEVALAPLGGWRRHRDTCEARMRELAEPEFEQSRAEGRTLTLDEAAALALAAPSGSNPTAS
jgi:predicted ATPase/class 3 adenylate cyclase